MTQSDVDSHADSVRDESIDPNHTIYGDDGDLDRFYSDTWTHVTNSDPHSYSEAVELPGIVASIAEEYKPPRLSSTTPSVRLQADHAPTATQRGAQKSRPTTNVERRRGKVEPRSASDTVPRPQVGSVVHPFKSQLDSAAEISTHNVLEHFCKLRYAPGRIGSIGVAGAKIWNYTYRGDIHMVLPDENGGNWVELVYKDVPFQPDLEPLTDSKKLYRNMGFKGSETSTGHTYTSPTGGVIRASTDAKQNEYLDGWVVVSSDKPQHRIRASRDSAEHPVTNSPAESTVVDLGADVVINPHGSPKAPIPESQTSRKPNSAMTEDELCALLEDRLKDISFTDPQAREIRARLASFGVHAFDNQLEFITRLHRRLGHRNLTDLAHFLKARGIQTSRITQIWCRACLQAKSKVTDHATLSKRPQHHPHIRAPGPKWSMDGVGPIRTSVRGYQYLWTFINDESKDAMIICTASNANFSHIAKQFIGHLRQTLKQHGLNELEIVMTQHCMQIRGDSARQFTSPESTVEFEQHGIRVAFSAPYTASSNSYVERFHQTLLQSAFSMIFHGWAPLSVWCFSAEHALAIYRMMPHSSLPKKQSPTEYLTGELPPWEWTETFWAVAAIYIPKSQRLKGQPRCVFGRWVGFDLVRRSHIVLIPAGDRWKVRYTAHCRVDPSSRPSRPSHLQVPSFVNDDDDHSDRAVAATTGPTAKVTEGIIKIPLTHGWYRVFEDGGAKQYYLHADSGRREIAPPTSSGTFADTLPGITLPVPQSAHSGVPNKPMDGTVCELPGCFAKLAKARQIRGERYCLKCHNAVLHERLRAAERAAATTNRSGTSVTTPTTTNPKSIVKSSVSSRSVQPKAKSPSPSTTVPSRATTPKASTPSRKPNQCPAGHQLRTGQVRKAFACTECTTDVTRKSTQHACRQCNFTLCTACGTKSTRQIAKSPRRNPSAKRGVSAQASNAAKVVTFTDQVPGNPPATPDRKSKRKATQADSTGAPNQRAGQRPALPPNTVQTRSTRSTVYSVRAAKIINDDIMTGKDRITFDHTAPTEMIRKVIADESQTPRWIRRLHAVTDPNVAFEPIAQIRRAVATGTGDPDQIFLAADAGGVWKWFGTVEHHGNEDPVDCLRRAKNTDKESWADKVCYSFKQTQNPNNPHRSLVPAAITREMDALLKPGFNGRRPPLVVVQRSSLPPGTELRKVLTLYSCKRGPDSEVTRGKVRVTFNGAPDRDRPNLPDCSARIASTPNIRTFAALTPDDPDDHVVKKGDLPNAYVWADNDRVEYVELPADIYPRDANGDLAVARVDGALYGKLNAGTLFEKKRDKFLTGECGLTQCKLDPSFFYNLKTGFRLAIVVDDLFWRSRRVASDSFESTITATFGDCKIHELDDHWTDYVGALIRRVANRLEWSSARAVKEALVKNDLTHIASTDIPAAPHSYVSKASRAEPDYADASRTSSFLRRQGCLQWIVTTGRYDVGVAVKQLATVMASPKPEHVGLQSKVFGYLQRTKDMALTWNPARSLEHPNTLYYYSDGSYTGEGLQSRMGFVGVMNGGAVIAENACPKFQCTGVFDVEEAASCWAAKDIVYRKAFLTELGYPQPQTKLYCDNAATVLFSEKVTITALNKHILVRGAYTRDCQAKGHLVLVHVPGVDNVSDQQTKNLPTGTFYGYLPDYGFICIPYPNGYNGK